MKLTNQFKQFLWQIKQEPLKYNQGSFFSLSEMLTAQLKVYTDQNIQSEVVPLETTQTRLVSDRNIPFILQ